MVATSRNLRLQNPEVLISDGILTSSLDTPRDEGTRPDSYHSVWVCDRPGQNLDDAPVTGSASRVAGGAFDESVPSLKVEI
jgi:hypothetical protein